MLVMTALILYFWPPDADANGIIPRIEGGTAIALLGGNVLVLLISMAISQMLPPAPQTNRKVRIPGSRFLKTPVAANA